MYSSYYVFWLLIVGFFVILWSVFQWWTLIVQATDVVIKFITGNRNIFLFTGTFS